MSDRNGGGEGGGIGGAGGAAAEESAAARSPARVLGMDVGNRRIGLALTDGLGVTAQPLLTVYRTTLKADLKSIGRVVRRHGVREVVIGLPLYASGEMSAQAEKTKAFGAALAQMLPELQMHWMDERWTTMEAQALLDQGRGRRGGMGAEAARRERKERSAVVDQVAAVLLLEAFLSVRSPRLLPDPGE